MTEDKGTAEQAIEFALTAGLNLRVVVPFLRDWRSGDLSDWPDYLRWLGERVASSVSEK